MKYAALLLVFLGLLNVHAAPRVGDKVNYDLKVTAAGVTKTGTMTFEFTDYDAANDEWTQYGERVLDGTVEHQEKKIPGRSILSDAMLENLIRRCKKNGGTLETLPIASGSIATCKLAIEDGYSWMGDVPLMRVVKMLKTVDDVETETTLTSFSRGEE